MELGLSLGNRGVTESNISTSSNINMNMNMNFCMGLGLNNNNGSSPSLSSSASPPAEKSTAEIKSGDEQHDDHNNLSKVKKAMGGSNSSTTNSSADQTTSSPRLQLDLLPFSPVVSRPSQPLRFPWLADNLSSEPGSSDGPGPRTVDVNRRPPVGVAVEEVEVEDQSSPNSGTSSLMEFSLYTSTNSGGNDRTRKRDSGHENGNNNNGNNYGHELMVIGVGGGDQGERGATTSRGSDDEENGSTRKKLRLSKEQSAFLEESFKEHHTLNPKQKLALAKQLNLRPRQVEVWFQNRRARTKLKQTEVDCEYLKRCCETLTEENRRLQKELQELRALKTSQPFFMQLPATTLTMCPSCERVAPTSTSGPATSAAATPAATAPTKPAACRPSATAPVVAGPSSVTLSLGKPKPMLPFSNNAQVQAQAQAHQAAS